MAEKTGNCRGDFELTRLCSVAGLDLLAGLQALDVLCQRGLIRDMQQPEASTVRFAFTHQWIREVAYAHASEARRQVSHRRAFEELAAAKAPITRLGYARAAGRSRRAVIQPRASDRRRKAPLLGDE